MASSLVSKVTTDDTTPIPVYALKELADYTNKSQRDSDAVRSAIVNRLNRTSPDIKFKALRTIKYICQNGRVDFKLSFQRDNAYIKSLVTFQCPPDDLRGDKPAENVRAEAAECLQAIFADNQSAPQSSFKVESFGSTGPMNNGSATVSVSSGSYGGFGTAPPKKQETDSFTGFNIRRTIASAVFNSDGRPLTHSYPQQSQQSQPHPQQGKYGGIGSGSFQQSTYSHYTHDPHKSQQQSQYQQQQYQQHQERGGYSQNGLYGGGGSEQNYNAARQHGYNTYSQHQQSTNQPQEQSTAGGLAGKSGPWGQHQQSSPPQQQSQPQQQPQQGYVPSGPSTKSSVEELGFEKRIVAQYTSNTPLKPTVTEIELKKFMQDSASCAIDDILLILNDIFAASTSPPATVAKSLQLYNTIITACGMVSQECDKDHLNTIQHLHSTTTNKHIKLQSEKVLIDLGLIQGPTPTNNAPVVGGFVSQQQQQQQQQTVPVQEQQPQQQTDNDPLGLFSNNTQQSNAPVKSTGGGMFGGLSLKPKTNTITSQEHSSFDFIDSSPNEQSVPQQPSNSNGNDLFALLGGDIKQTKPSGGLDLDALYAPTQQSAPQQQQQQQQQSSSSSAFDFMVNSTPQNHNDDIFGDLLGSQQPKQTQQPIQQQPKPQQDMSSFDFVDSFM